MDATDRSRTDVSRFNSARARGTEARWSCSQEQPRGTSRERPRPPIATMTAEWMDTGRTRTLCHFGSSGRSSGISAFAGFKRAAALFTRSSNSTTSGEFP